MNPKIKKIVKKYTKKNKSRLPLIDDVAECPHCHSTDGYYSKEKMKGTVTTNFTFDKTDAHNEDMYESLITVYVYKFYYCCNCNKKLAVNKWE